VKLDEVPENLKKIENKGLELMGEFKYDKEEFEDREAENLGIWGT